MFPDMETSAPSTVPRLVPTPNAGNWGSSTGHRGQRVPFLSKVAADPALRLLTSSPVASPASRGAWPGRDGDSPTIVGSGPSSSEPFASWDPGTSSWRTSQGSWLEEEAWGLSSEDWPRSGMTRNGTAFRQAPSAPLTGGIASGSLEGDLLWPTPRTTGLDGGSNSRKAAKARGMWPTPTVDDSSNVTRESGSYQSLTGAVRWPTPSAEDNRDRGNLSMPSIQRRQAIGKQLLLSMVADPTSGALNPTWVEWLMGFPAGWTDCEHLATPSFRKSLKRSGGGS